MKQAVITRVSTDINTGTTGILTVDSYPVCVTLEDYKYGNMKNLSCIPTGQYLCKRYSSKKHPKTFIITNVSERSYILIHPGNNTGDTEGCIILGSEFGPFKDHYLTIIDSRSAFDKFMDIMEKEEEFKLTIREVF